MTVGVDECGVGLLSGSGCRGCDRATRSGEGFVTEGGGLACCDTSRWQQRRRWWCCGVGAATVTVTVTGCGVVEERSDG